MSKDLLSLHHLSKDPDHLYSSWPSIPPNPIGRLILQTPEITQKAAQEEILTGQRFSLDHSVFPSGALLYTRPACKHVVKRVDKGPKTLAESQSNGEPYEPVFDDFVELNTQSTTQWDYFMHYSYRGSGLFYGGLTAEQIESENTGDIGVASIAKAGGVQTRAILIDLPLYFAEHSLPPLDPLTYPSSTPITFSLLQSALKYFNLVPRVGDVLLIRTGFEETLLEDVKALQDGSRKESLLKGLWAGVQATEETLHWIWQTGFVAVGSDNPTFEEWKPLYPDMKFHPILLSGMGIMIGEIMRLKAVAAECQRRKKWSFYISSIPLMVEHGVASPLNAVAIL